jgi:hypothetical protein
MKQKLFMILLGSKPPGRHVEQHDFFFGIAHTLKDLVSNIKLFWPEAGDTIHIDGWREVTSVDGHRVIVTPRTAQEEPISDKKLFFINLGGYQENRFEEQHYTVLTVKSDRATAFKHAKKSLFFKQGISTHIDDKYGIDVDDLYEIGEILDPEHKSAYRIELVPAPDLQEDPIHLGYWKLNKLP